MAYNFQTFGNVVDDTFAELGIDANNTVAGLGQAQVESWANRYSKVFIEKVRLKTQYDTYSFRTVADTALAANAASGATSITTAVSQATLGAPTSGLIILDGIPYTYSAFSSTTMTVEALDRAFSSGDVIQFGYAVPTNFGKPVSLYMFGGTDMYPTSSAIPLELKKWGTFDTLKDRQYAVFNDFLILPEGVQSANDVKLDYYKKAANTLTTNPDLTFEIYQMWDSYVIYRGTARGHRLLHDDNLASTYEMMAKEVLAQAKTQAGQDDLSVNRGFVPGF